MKIKIGDKEIFEISDSDLKVLEHDLIDVEAEIPRRLEWFVRHAVEESYRKIRAEWTEKFFNDPSVKSIPAEKEKFLSQVFSHPEYKNKKKREARS